MGNKLPKTALFMGILYVLFIAAALEHPPEPVQLNYPKTWPVPTYDFTKNPLTKEGIALGRQLFYDPILSKDSTVSCSNCHLSYTAFTHVDHDLSHGIGDRIGTRNSPALVNLAWATSFMWDGAANHLDMQALAPISSPVEMDETIENVVKKIGQKSDYKVMFYHAFGDSTVTGEHLLKALSQFELTLISTNSKYDQMKRGEAIFTEQENNGYILFKNNCARCHTEPLFTNFKFENNGLPIDTTLNDYGRGAITKQPVDTLKFKVPTLRNIEFSYPYMHDGRFRKLGQVLNHYSQDKELGIELAPNEKVDLIAFLLTLTDKAFLFNPDFGY